MQSNESKSINTISRLREYSIENTHTDNKSHSPTYKPPLISSQLNLSPEIDQKNKIIFDFEDNSESENPPPNPKCLTEFSEFSQHGQALTFRSFISLADSLDSTNTKNLIVFDPKYKIELYYPDGSLKYKGEVVDRNIPHGYGTLYNRKNGHKIYKGDLYLGYREGFGCSFYSYKDTNVIAYQGDWTHNEKSGKGTEFYISGKLSYEGNWKDG